MATAIRAKHARLRFVALLALTGAACSGDDIILDDPGHDQNQETVAFGVSLAMRTAAPEFLAAWDGDAAADDVEAREVHAQRTNALTGASMDVPDLALTGNGENGHTVRVAYSPAHDEYLVVWSSEAADGLLARRVNAATGAQIGAATQIGSGLSGSEIVVAYNSADDEYLVSWGGKAQRIDAATGLEVGADDFPIGLQTTSIAYDAVDDQYLMVRAESQGLHGTIIGLRIAGDGTPVDSVPVVLVPDASLQLAHAVVSFAPELGWYLLVWTQGSGYTDLYGELLDHTTLANVGASRFPITTVGTSVPPGSAFQPQIAWDAGALEFVVPFFGKDGSSIYQADEVFVQRVYAPTATVSCPAPFRISDRSPLGAPNYPPDSAYPLSVGVHPSSGQVAVAWDGYAATAPNPIPPPPFFLEFDVYADVFARGCTP